MSGPVFSLIVPTINRTQELIILLESLRQQQFKSFEVIIVDQNQEDILSVLLQGFEDSLPIKHLRIPPRGASGARNAGIAWASGQILTFPDDDCYYPADLLQVVYEVFQDQTLAGLCATSSDPNSKGRIARLDRHRSRVHRFNILKTVVEFAVFVRARLLTTTQFDEDLGVGSPTGWWSDEGPDLVLRLIESGNDITYRPDIVIYHPDPVQVLNAKALNRSYKYGCGRGRFLRKHHYPFWFAFYVFGLYLAGMGIGVIQFNLPKFRYFFKGFQGRILGYYGKI